MPSGLHGLLGLVRSTGLGLDHEAMETRRKRDPKAAFSARGSSPTIRDGQPSIATL